MDSDIRNECSHSLGFPIRKSPDHSLLAASRSLSQLTTSFFAFLRLGIHTHALSSLTIKSTSHTSERYFPNCAFYILVFCMPVKYSIVKDLDCLNSPLNPSAVQLTADRFLVGPGGIEPPTSPLSGVRSSHLSYGPSFVHLVELVGIEPATS